MLLTAGSSRRTQSITPPVHPPTLSYAPRSFSKNTAIAASKKKGKGMGVNSVSSYTLDSCRGGCFINSVVLVFENSRFFKNPYTWSVPKI